MGEVDLTKLSDDQLETASELLSKRQQERHRKYMEEHVYRPRREAEAELIAGFQVKYGIDENQQYEIHAAWSKFYENWG